MQQLNRLLSPQELKYLRKYSQKSCHEKANVLDTSGEGKT